VKDALSTRGGWTWVHIGLADARARIWIAHHAPVSDMAREVLSGSDEHIRLDILGSEIIGVMPDLHHAFAQPAENIVRLRFVLTERSTR
jgi:zinc transporter